MSKTKLTPSQRKNGTKKRPWSKCILRTAFFSAVSWGAFSHYCPTAADVVQSQLPVNEVQSWFETNDTAHRQSLYDEMPLYLLGGTAENIAGQYNHFAERWYKSVGRYHMLMNDPENKSRMDDFLHQFDYLKPMSIKDKAATVDYMIDQHIDYTSDFDLYASSEYWADPIESMIHGKGDCDDYAIMKYFVLRYLNVPIDKVHLLLVENPDEGVYKNRLNHMVLSVDIGRPTVGQAIGQILLPKKYESSFDFNAEPDIRILDNDTVALLKPEGECEYRPFYALNEKNCWKFKSQK